MWDTQSNVSVYNACIATSVLPAITSTQESYFTCIKKTCMNSEELRAWNEAVVPFVRSHVYELDNYTKKIPISTADKLTRT